MFAPFLRKLTSRICTTFSRYFVSRTVVDKLSMGGHACLFTITPFTNV